MNRWAWVFQYGVACVLVLLLAAILGHSQLFQHTTLGPRGLAASNLVRFLGDAAALLLVWLAAARAATWLPGDGSWRALVRHTITPLATLIVLTLGYGVPLFLLRPFLNDAAMIMYGWVFVVAIIGAALWLALEAYEHADVLASVGSSLAPSVPRTATRHHDTSAASAPRCSECGTTLPPGATSCQNCGHRVAA